MLRMKAGFEAIEFEVVEFDEAESRWLQDSRV